jgi:small-conductance mechanosensitive channel
MVQEWSEFIFQTLQGLFERFLVDFLPKLIVAIIAFVAGWFLALLVGKLVAEILNRLKLNRLLERTGWKEAFEKAEIKMNPSEFIGAIFKWVLVIVALLVAVEILGLPQFAALLNRFVGWLPNLIVAIAILIVAIIVADILQKIIKASAQKIGVKYVGILGGIVRWGIYILAIFAILLQLNIATTIVNAFILGFIGMLSLAFGLAFGLGGRDAAAKIIEDLRKKISE